MSCFCFLSGSSDNTPPDVGSCPSNMEVNVTEDSSQMTVFWTIPNTTENDVSMVSNFSPGDSFPIGTTQVIYIFTDAAGNSQNCEFYIDIYGKRRLRL